MAVTDYLQKSSGTCRYSYNKLKSVLYLVSEEHIKDVIIDNGEAYISGLTELPLRINGFNIQFKEETSLDERYKFQKTLTLSMHGYVNYKIFGGRYYAIVESMDGTYFMINVDFPSRITHTFNLSKDTNQTDFTFASLSNFPTLKLNAEFEAVEPVCLGLRVHGIDTLELLEREKAVLDTENKRVISTEDFKKVEFLGDSCTFQEVYDGFKVTDTITFDIALDNYKPSWQYNLLEFLDNRYASIITPKGGDNKYYPGFNFGLQPNYTIQTASQNGQSDIITVTLVEMSSYGTTAANDWSDDQDTETRWRWVKKVNDIICYECIGLGKARYLVKQEVDAFGVPTGDYQVMEGYESQYPVFHIVGTFTEQQIFDTSDCGDESSCTITSDIPATVVFTSTTCNTYSLKTTCDWQITDIPSHITVSPTTGVANSSYTVTICNTMAPTATPFERNISLKCCRNIRLINTKVMQGDNTCLKPSTKQINCLGQAVTFTYNGSCQINVTSIDPSLTYQVGYNTLTVQVPRNYGTSAITWNITYSNCNCNPNSESVSIIQDKQYERWVEDSGYICDSGNSYHIEVKYTGTTADNINTRTSETRKGSLIQSGDTRCGSQTKWEWDNVSYTCVDGNKYKLLYEYTSTDGGTTWTKTGNTMVGDLVEEQSSYCEQPIVYGWSATSQYNCSGTTSYYLYQKYQKQGEGDWTPVNPSVFSIDGNGEMPLNKKQDNDPNCGYTPEPIYDWENMNPSTDYYCLNCGTDGYKVFGRLSGDTLFSFDCNNSSTLTSVETRPYSSMTYTKVGTCVTELGSGAFALMGGLSGITIPNTVTTIGTFAFSGTNALIDCILPTSVTSIGDGAFINCTSLTNFVLWDSITTIGESAFTNCDSLISVNIPSGLTNISDYCFLDCGALSEITIPTGVTRIGAGAFQNCSGLTSITCIAETPPSLGSYALFNTNNCPIYVPAESVETYKTSYYWSDFSSRITAIPNS